MIQEREKRAEQLEFKAAPQKKRRGSAFAWELRQSFAWIWLLPLLIIAGAFLFSWLGYLADLHTQASLSNTIYAHQRIKVVLDYSNPLRDTLELLLPIVSVFLTTDLLLREWRRGTLMLLATRKSLLWFLVVRFSYLLGYLLLINTGAILLGWWLTPIPQTALDIGTWFWQTLLTVMAPTLLLMALGLLVAHLSVNTIASYVLPACCWLANWLYALQVEQSHTTSPVLSYLLFGWLDKGLTPFPDNWLPGKMILCILALLLLALQPLLLHRVTLRHKDAE